MKKPEYKIKETTLYFSKNTLPEEVFPFICNIFDYCTLAGFSDEERADILYITPEETDKNAIKDVLSSRYEAEGHCYWWLKKDCIQQFEKIVKEIYG